MHITDFGSYAGIAVAVAAWITLAVQGRRNRRDLRQENQDVRDVVLGEGARPGIPSRPGINDRLAGIEKATSEIRSQLGQAAILNGKGEQLISQVAATRRDQVIHQAAVNANMTGLREDMREVAKRQTELVVGLKVDRERWRESLTNAGIDVPSTDHFPEA